MEWKHHNINFVLIFVKGYRWLSFQFIWYSETISSKEIKGISTVTYVQAAIKCSKVGSLPPLKAHQWKILTGSFDYGCFSFLSSEIIVPGMAILSILLNVLVFLFWWQSRAYYMNSILSLYSRMNFNSVKSGTMPFSWLDVDSVGPMHDELLECVFRCIIHYMWRG